MTGTSALCPALLVLLLPHLTCLCSWSHVCNMADVADAAIISHTHVTDVAEWHTVFDRGLIEARPSNQKKSIVYCSGAPPSVFNCVTSALLCVCIHFFALLPWSSWISAGFGIYHEALNAWQES